MKVLFLDVDGVLNSEECLDAPEESLDFIYDSSTIVPLLKRCIDNLQEICELTSAKVIYLALHKEAVLDCSVRNCFCPLQFNFSQFVQSQRYKHRHRWLYPQHGGSSQICSPS